jgi:hypothetical protein
VKFAGMRERMFFRLFKGNNLGEIDEAVLRQWKALVFREASSAR